MGIVCSIGRGRANRWLAYKTPKKSFAVSSKQYSWSDELYVTIYANTSLPSELFLRFPILDGQISHPDGRCYTDIFKVKCSRAQPDTAKSIIDWLVATGWTVVPQYQLECNSFSILQKPTDQNNDRIIFSCTSTGHFSGIPTDMKGADWSEMVEFCFPGKSKFSAPAYRLEDVRQILLSYGWHER